MTHINAIKALSNPKFVKPIEIHYTLNNIPRVWEAVISHDAVSILLYHTQKEAFIAVKQFRVPVLNANKKDGFTYELCAGILDKDVSLEQTAKEEVLEECGYDVPVESLQRVTSYYTSVGISGAQQTLFYAQCDESMKVNAGGGLEDEDIEVIYIPLKDAKEFMFDEKYKKTPGMMMAFYWFFENIKRG